MVSAGAVRSLAEAAGVINRLVQDLSDEADHQRVLTGIRGWAALSVFLFHVWFLTGKPAFLWRVGGITVDLTPPVSIGFAGVTMFFVLSGYLLTLPFAEWQAGMRDRPATPRYLFRRVLRVFPAYYAQLAVLLILIWTLAWPAPLPDASAFLKHLLMFLFPPPLGAAPLNGVWWTLPIEFSFYLALPVLAVLLKPARWPVLVGVCIVSMVGWRFLMVTLHADAPVTMRVLTSYQLPGALDMFGCGMLAAVIQTNRTRLPAWIDHALGHNATWVLGLVLMLVAAYWLASDRQHYWANYPIFYLWTPCVSLATALLILSGVSGNKWSHRLFGNPVIVFFGVISYSYYLWHLPVIEGLLSNTWVIAQAGRGFPAILVTSAVLTVGLSIISYSLVERPAMRFRRRI